MKKLLLVGLLALPLSLLPAPAHAYDTGTYDVGGGLYFRGNPCYGGPSYGQFGGAPNGGAPNGGAPNGGGKGWSAGTGGGQGGHPVFQAGPWYLYWPLEAHFQNPAPIGYPFWPSPMGLAPNVGNQNPMMPSLGCAPPMGPPMMPPVQPAGLQPVNYQYPYYYAPPAYWYPQ
jgi:hypothetical protein